MITDQPIVVDFDPTAPGVYLGKGVSWPPREDPATGDLAVSSDDEHIADCLRNLLHTQFGEIVLMEPVGTLVEQLLFSNTLNEQLDLVEQSVRNAISTFETRVIVIQVQFELKQEDSLLGVVARIVYRVKATQQTNTLAIPFAVRGQ